MTVTKGQIISRGLSNRCPNCGERTLFPRGSLRVNRKCSNCGLDLDRGEGFFLGPWCLNYGIVVFGVVLPVIVLANLGIIPWGVALGVSAVGCFGIPALLYRSSWSWWLMIYFFFLPQRLPANGGPIGLTAED
jgi:uncharacterized protein (DUF983 family)